MEKQEDMQDRTLRALQVAAVSGFVTGICELQRSCLGLCNACRDGVPIPLLTIALNAPSSLLRSFSFGKHQTEVDPVSRVVPHRWVLCVELKFPGCRFIGYSGKRTNDEDGWGSGAMVDMNKIIWPEGTIHITLDGCNQPIQGVIWPESLKRLTFGGASYHSYSSIDCSFSESVDFFNQSLDGVHFPSGLRELFLGEIFNQPIDNVAWPEGMEKLSLPGFNHPIDKVRWPTGLKVLELMPSRQVAEKGRVACGFQLSSFNQPIDTGLPGGLHTLWLSNDFNQPIETVVWPTGLVTIGFGVMFKQYMKGSAWPSTLREVFLVRRPVDFEDGGLPPGCSISFRREPASDSDAEGSYSDGSWEYDVSYGWDYHADFMNMHRLYNVLDD